MMPTANTGLLKNKVALVTGGASGIGRATALAMAEAGANVAVADIDLAAAQRTADQAAGNARRALAIEADCGDVGSIDAMVARNKMGGTGRRVRVRALVDPVPVANSCRGEKFRQECIDEHRDPGFFAALRMTQGNPQARISAIS